MQMWNLGTWFSVGLGSSGLMVELNDLRGLFQPRLLFCDSIRASKQKK